MVDGRVPVRLLVFWFNAVVIVNFTALFDVDEANDSHSFQEEARRRYLNDLQELVVKVPGRSGW